MRARMSIRGLQEITFQRKILDNQELTGSLRYGSGHVSVSTADRSFEPSVAETGSSARSPPRGFNGVLTRQEWKGVIDFCSCRRNPRCCRRLDSNASTPIVRLHKIEWRQHCCGRVYERTNLRRAARRRAMMPLREEPSGVALLVINTDRTDRANTGTWTCYGGRALRSDSPRPVGHPNPAERRRAEARPWRCSAANNGRADSSRKCDF
jgi:hypothetical protein